MKYAVAALFALGLSTAAQAESHAIPQETVDAIMEMLSDMNCQMDAGDIEMEDDGGYDLDDVICEGGNQFDIKLDADLAEVSRRAE